MAGGHNDQQPTLSVRVSIMQGKSRKQEAPKSPEEQASPVFRYVGSEGRWFRAFRLKARP